MLHNDTGVSSTKDIIFNDQISITWDKNDRTTQEGINEFIIIVGDVNTPISEMDETRSQKIRIEIIQCLFLDYNGIKLEINNREISYKIVEIENYISK